MNPAVRGLAHAIMDAYWADPDCVSDADAMADTLMLDATPDDLARLSSLMPHLLNYIDRERQALESFMDKKREAGRMGGLAKASGAKQSLAEPSSATEFLAQPSKPYPYLPKDSNTPPTPPRKRRGVQEAGQDDLDLLEECFKLHPSRKSESGNTLAKGTRIKALPRIQDRMKRFRLERDDVLAIQRSYQKHPNVAGGFVQAVEVFWGDEGRWLDCWQQVQHERRKAAEGGE